MSEHSQSQSGGKKFLYALPVFVVLIAWNLFFNPEARELVGLKKAKPAPSIFSFFRRKSGPVAAAHAQPPAFSAKEFGVFSESFTQRKVPQGLMIVTNKQPQEIVTETEEEKAKRLEEEKRRKEEEEKRNRVASLWSLRVQGAYQDLQGRWTAIVSGHNVRAGDRLASGTEGKCVYSLLAIGNQCVWMRVLPPGADSATLAKLPDDIVWPNVALIELDRKFLRPDYVPARVRLGNGATLGKNDSLKYQATGTTFSVKELWMNGVVFVVRNNDAYAELACVLVTQ